MTIMRREPFREMISLRQALGRRFVESFIRPTAARPTRHMLAVDVQKLDDEFVLKTSVPGLKPENLNVSIVGDTVTLAAEIQEETEKEEANFLLKERHSGSFSRSLTLPTALNPDKAEATLEDGILTLRIPKAESVKPKPIKVKVR